MEPDKKKSFLLRNIEWIALIILIIAGLVALWQYYFK
jgi:predicted negative regulator of RcsB-dependent stress response